MRKDFKRKLQEYHTGTLNEEQHQEVEQELEKLEAYQQVLDEMMNEGEIRDERTEKERQLVRYGKRKSAFANVRNTIFVLIVLYIVGGVLGNLYFQMGGRHNSRSERYREALAVTIATTHPNVTIRGINAQGTFPFRLDMMSSYERIIGNEQIHLGEFRGHFFFSNYNHTAEMPYSLRMDPSGIFRPSDDWSLGDLWYLKDEAFYRLEQLGSHTMSELFISFDRHMSMEEVFEHFRGREMEVNWMAVESGNHHFGPAEIGIPGNGYMLRQNIEIEEHENGWFSSYVWASRLEEVERREKEFLDALRIMNNHPSILQSFHWHGKRNIEATISYIEENGVQIFGVVVTGPTEELLTLQNEPWIRQVQIGVVTFLNWTSVLED